MKLKSLPSVDSSQPIWYLEKNDSKSFSITWTALSLIIISMGSIWIMTNSSLVYLERIKLISIFN